MFSHLLRCVGLGVGSVFFFPAIAVPVIDPVPNASVPAGKSLTVPITASSSNGRPLTYTVTSSTNRITVEIHTNNPFWKMSVVQIAPSNAPGAYHTYFRGALATVTNIGDMTFMLLRDRAPRSVDAIAALTTSGFYNSNTIFHRVVLVPYFIIQGGDPNTNGAGGPIFRYDDEIHPRSLYSGIGQLAMANSGPDSSGSQFFVTTAPQRSFDLRYTIIGQLLRGFNVMSNIVNTPTNASSRPLADVIITRASLVANTTDAVITLTGTNFAGVIGTIRIIADDGVGGRATNTFTATTVSDSANNAPPVLYPASVTNHVSAMNGRITNHVAVLDLEGNTPQWEVRFLDQVSLLNASNSTFNGANGQLVIIPATNYTGPIRLYTAVAPNSLATYDIQRHTFAIGDTMIAAQGTSFTARPHVPITNQLLATFTNGVMNSPTDDFTASINWGDNSTNSGVLLTAAGGGKEVRGSHTYTHSGDYPIYVTIRSTLGADATVVSTALVPPDLNLTRLGTNNILQWAAWAADYQLQAHTNLSTPHWSATIEFPALLGYENVVTSSFSGSSMFFRLKR